MDDIKSKRASELSAAELLQLAAAKLGIEGETLTDLEVGLEGAARALLKRALSERLNASEPETAPKCPRCGKKNGVRSRGKERTLQTLGGAVTYKRNYAYCSGCRQGYFPRDEAFQIPKSGEVSSELERRILDFAMVDPFAQGAERFALHYRQAASTNLLRRVFERTSERLLRCEDDVIQAAVKAPTDLPDEAVTVVQSDGSMVSTTAGWKEVKLGVVYAGVAKTGANAAKQRPKDNRDKRIGGARFVASMQGVQAFEDALEQALYKHGTSRPSTVVWLGDGAPGFWNIADRVCPDATQILDWYHAIEHASDCANVLLDDADLQRLWVRAIKRALMEDNGIERLLDELQACVFLADTAEQRQALIDLRRYYKTHRHRMNYVHYRQMGWPIGSGAVESAHRHVIQARMKRAGQHWSPKVAHKMAAMRAHYATAGPKNFHQAIAVAASNTRRNTA